MRRRSSLIAAATIAGLALSVGLAEPALAGGRSPDTGAGSGASPSRTAHYTPRPGDWRRYVLAPTDHTVTPTKVLFSEGRGGSITGDPAATLPATGRSKALGAKSVTLTSSKAGTVATSPLLALDFGKEVGGKISVRVTGGKAAAGAAAPVLHACFSESRADMALTADQNGGEAAYAPGCDTANIFNGFPGQAYTYDSDSHALTIDTAKLPATVKDAQIRGGFRYLTFFLSGAGSVSIGKVSLDFQASPAQADPAAYKGWFLSSDDELNKIWYAGAYTVQMNTWLSNTAKSWPYTTGETDTADSQIPFADPKKEVILDGAKRDRIVWQGDLAVQAPVTYLTTGDVDAVENSLSSLAAQQQPDGYVPAESLVGQHNLDEERTYGEYVTWYVNNLYEHWLYTGDRSYLAANWKGLVAATAWMEAQRDSTGLVSFQASGSCGHYGYSDCGHETYVNSLVVRNLRQMSTLAGVLGHPGGSYANAATSLAAAVNTQLWDQSAGAYRLSTETPTVFPQDANAAVILTGVAPAARATKALAYLRANNWSTFGSLSVSPSTPGPQAPNYEPLPSGFEASARLASSTTTGQSLGEQLIKTYWGYQLQQDPGGTFWEKAATDGTPGLQQFTSLAHGWASGPTISLTQQVLGVTPVTGGYKTFSVVPRPGTVSWSQGSVPTPHGSIAASWKSTKQKFALTTTVPRGTSASLAVPASAHSTVRLDGLVVYRNGHVVSRAGVTVSGGYVSVAGVHAGTHALVAAQR